MQTVGGLSAQQAAALPEPWAIESELKQITARIERDPKSAHDHFLRAEFHARLGRWRESAADHLRMTELTPEDRMPWLRAAAPLLLAGDRDGYQELSRRVAKQFHDTTMPMEADVVCKVALLAPDTIPLAEYRLGF